MTDSEVEDAFDGENESENEEAQVEEKKVVDSKCDFAIGSVVFPVEKETDCLDPSAVLINHADSFVGKHLGIYLSDKKVGEKSGEGEDEELGEEEEEDEDTASKRGAAASKNWKLLGTLSEERGAADPPFLWATVVQDDFEAYLKELLKCSVVIYDITEDPSQERINEVRRVCDALREKVPVFTTRRVFILIASLHSWSHTTRPKDDPEFMFSESDYRRRRTKPLYRELQLLERYVVASGKMTKGMLKAYVIGAGAIYGEEENCLHTWFKSAWYNAKYLPIYGSGKNFMPTIYIKDLAQIVQNVMDLTPRQQRYIIAVDPVLSQQDQVVKAISTVLGTGKVKKVPEEDIYLNRELNTFQADQILLDLPIESTFCRDNFDIEWASEQGLENIIKKIVNEYRKARSLTPLKVVIVGPPGVGKSTVARQLSDIYRFHHFTKDELIESTLALLREIAGDEEEPTEIAGVDAEVETASRLFAQNLLEEVDASMAGSGQLNDDLLIKLFRYRLKTNAVQNQGFLLDGFPETYDQAKALFAMSEGEGEGADEEMGEDQQDALDPQLIPDHVIILEAPDDFLKQRLLKVPIEMLEDRHNEENYGPSLDAYNESQQEYEKTFVAYLNDQEILYDPIDVSEDRSDMMQGTTAKVSHILGRPRNYGLTLDEEEAIKNAQRCERAELDRRLREDMDMMKNRLLDSRRKNIEQWMEKLEKTKREEFEREEAAMIPLRHYLMAHVVPTLTKGLIDITRARPEDPIDYLAEFLFQNNPGGVNPCGERLFF